MEKKKNPAEMCRAAAVAMTVVRLSTVPFFPLLDDRVFFFSVFSTLGGGAASAASLLRRLLTVSFHLSAVVVGTAALAVRPHLCVRPPKRPQLHRPSVIYVSESLSLPFFFFTSKKRILRYFQKARLHAVLSPRGVGGGPSLPSAQLLPQPGRQTLPANRSPTMVKKMERTKSTYEEPTTVLLGSL